MTCQEYMLVQHYPRYASHCGSIGDTALALTQADLGRRIAQARAQRGLSQAQLAELVSLTQSAISRIESGDRSIDSLELSALSRALEVSPLDLLREDSEDEGFRLSARVAIDRSLDQLTRGIDRLDEFITANRILDELDVEKMPIPPRPELPLPEGTAIEQGEGLAKLLREHFGLGADPLPHLFFIEMVEYDIGLDIALEPIASGVSGLLVDTDDLSVALIDSSPVLARQRFTIAHEVCHYLCRDADPYLIDEQLFGQTANERRANAFAAYFLMPRDGIARIVQDNELDLDVVAELQYSFGVSLEALLWHLKNLSLISDRKRHRVSEIGAKALAYRTGYIAEWEAAERMRDLVRPPSRVLRRALGAYGKGLIGIERLARILGRSDTVRLQRELEEVGIAPEEGWISDTSVG